MQMNIVGEDNDALQNNPEKVEGFDLLGMILG